MQPEAATAITAKAATQSLLLMRSGWDSFDSLVAAHLQRTYFLAPMALRFSRSPKAADTCSANPKLNGCPGTFSLNGRRFNIQGSGVALFEIRIKDQMMRRAILSREIAHTAWTNSKGGRHQQRCGVCKEPASLIWCLEIAFEDTLKSGASVRRDCRRR